MPRKPSPPTFVLSLLMLAACTGETGPGGGGDGGSAVTGSGGKTAGGGGTVGSGGKTGGGGTVGSGGKTGAGGSAGSGGKATGSGGKAGSGGSTTGAGGSAGAGGSTDPYAAYREQCVTITNNYRTQVGVSPLLTSWTAQSTCADGQAKSDSQTGTAHGAFGDCTEMAQNECPGWGGDLATVITDCLAMMFAEGPGEPYSEHGHYINMTSTSYTKLACGFYKTAAGKWWVIQDFR